MINHLISFEMTGAVYVLTLINNILCMLPGCCLYPLYLLQSVCERSVLPIIINICIVIVVLKDEDSRRE